MSSSQPFTTIPAHSKHVAADESAAQLIVSGELSSQTREAISLALDQPSEQWEYGFSTAIDPNDGKRHYSTPTRGYRRGTAPTGPPNSILNNQVSGTPFSDVVDEPTKESAHRYEYTGLIGVHTHLLHDGNVGLSAADLMDDMFGGDHLSRQHLPFEIYRAKAAIVFADNPSRLPTIQPNQLDYPSESASHPNKNQDSYILKSRPKARPWLHLLERTTKASSLSKSEANEIHYNTLDPLPTGNEENRYQAALSRIEPYVSELVIPLSP